MSDHDPIAEWRARWQQSDNPQIYQLGIGPNTGTSENKPPRSPWVYAGAAFGGTIAALAFSLLLCVGLLVVVSAKSGGFDTTPNSLTYHNDTPNEVYVYECYERCLTYQWGFMLEAGEESSFELEWYYDDPIEWVIVTREDSSYGCIHLADWKDQTLSISNAVDCPKDIHSPETEIY